MTSVYDIAVKLSVTGNAEQALGSLIKSLGLAELASTKLIKAMGGIGPAITTVGSALAVDGIVNLGKHLVTAGAQVADVAAKLKALGDTDVDVQLDIAAAQKAAQMIGGVTTASALQQLVELRSVTATEAEARAVLETYATAARDLALFNGGHGTQHDVSTILPLLKAAETQGAFNKDVVQPDGTVTKVIDVARINAAIKAAEAALELTNGVLTPSTFMRMTTLAGPAAQQVDWTTWVKEMTEVAMAMGPTGGRGAMMAFKTLVGGAVTKAEAEALQRLGLVKPEDVLKDHGHYSLKQGALQGYDTLTHEGLDQWWHKVALPALTAQNGGKPVDDATIASAFASFPITMQRLLAFFSTNDAQIQKFGAQFDQRQATDAQKALMDSSVTANTQALGAAWQDLMQTLGGPLVTPAIGVLHGLTAGVKEFTALGQVPGVSAGVDLMLGATGVALSLKTISGGIRLLTGISNLASTAVGLEATASGLGAVSGVAGLAGLGASLSGVAVGLGAVVAATALAAKGLGDVAAQHEAYQKAHPDAPYVDPYSGTVVPGVTNKGLLPPTPPASVLPPTPTLPGGGAQGVPSGVAGPQRHSAVTPGLDTDTLAALAAWRVGDPLYPHDTRRGDFLRPSADLRGAPDYTIPGGARALTPAQGKPSAGATAADPMYVRAVDQGSQQPIYLVVDGRVLGQIVAKQLTGQATLPQGGTSAVDLSMGAISSGHQIRS
jgi:hypothetical protein